MDAKTCLIVIDGWGVNEQALKGDAIANAKTPVMDKLDKEYPSITIAAHGNSVGLPQGLMGNSEVGHLNIGAGRVVWQDIVRIDMAVKKNTLKKCGALIDALELAKSQGRIQFLGLVSDGGVHSHINHLKALLTIAKDAGVPEAYVHVFGDGRDTSPKSLVGYMEDLLGFMKEINYGKVATVTGRYYAMDRDKRWERVELAYEALVDGQGEQSANVIETIKQRYDKDENDEFLKPIIVDKEGIIKDNDTLLFFNYRSDRMRQITQVFGKIGGQYPFEVKTQRKNLHIVTMTTYKSDYPFPVLFPPQKMTNVLSQVVSNSKLSQLHVAETEKYAHVTFFFNGGTETQYDGEDRLLVPSPKGVATYDLKPEMSAIEVGHQVALAILNGISEKSEVEYHPSSVKFGKTGDKYNFVMCNFAPPDMVGHTGKYEAAIKAVEATDQAIGEIYEACKKAGYVLFITADHGNAEKMMAEDGSPHTAHTCARVPFIMVSDKLKFRSDLSGRSEGDSVKETGGALCDVAPTLLKVMGIQAPEEMSGESLLK